MGSGKTTFTNYLVKSLGIKDGALSPTFSIMNEYCSKKHNIIHIDAYRLNKFQNLELDDIFPKVISIIEWPKNLKFREEDINIKFEYLDDKTRNISLLLRRDFCSKIYQDLIVLKERNK